ncbi:MAG: PKD domain-containing protein [Bacteroidota bacterium]|nr:PKD domain-containing protein [Bacteroidota bacterium]
MKNRRRRQFVFFGLLCLPLLLRGQDLPHKEWINYGNSNNLLYSFDSELPGYNLADQNDLFLASNRRGEMIFYVTNGDTVKDHTGQPMPHGCLDSIFSLISYNNQGNVITNVLLALRSPADTDIYFLIINDFIPNGFSKPTQGLATVQVDMRLNGGRGDVVPQTFTSFHPYSTYSDGRYRPVIPVPMPGGGYWLAFEGTYPVMVFPLTGAGVGKPVVSDIKTSESYSALAFSQDGRFAVSTLAIHGDSSCIYGYNFDLNTGKFSDERLLAQSSLRQRFLYPDDMFWHLRSTGPHYGRIAFSPNDSLFYVAIRSPYGALKGTWDGLVQFERFAPDISKTAVMLPVRLPDVLWDRNFKQLSFHFLLDIKTGPNGKMYFTHGPDQNRDTWMGMIWYPNRKGAACKVLSGVHITDTGRLSYPYSFPQSLYSGFPEFRIEESCKGYLFRNLSDSIFTSFTWVFGDGDTLQTNSRATVRHIFRQGGKFLVKMLASTDYGYSAWYSDSLEVNITLSAAATLQGSRYACQWAAVSFNDTICYQASLSPQARPWHWDYGDGATDTLHHPAHTYTSPGSYTVKFVADNGFEKYVIVVDTIEVRKATKPRFIVFPLQGCTPLQVSVADSSEGAGHTRVVDFGTGATDTSAHARVIYDTPGRYRLKFSIQDSSGCVIEDSAFVEVRQGAVRPDMMGVSLTSDARAKICYMLPPGIDARLYRSESHGLPRSIAVLRDSGCYTDSTIAGNSRTYTYTLLSTDSCGSVSDSSLRAKTILLTTDRDENNWCSLRWTPYEDWQQGVLEYRIEKAGSANPFRTIAVVNSSVHQYTDHDFRSDSAQQFCYRIRAIERGGHAWQSLSNTVCEDMETEIWIPNSFSPNGDFLNDSFSPVWIGVDRMEMVIYDRWGNRIFHSEDKDKLWDGAYRGRIVSSGVYLYKISISGSSGTKFYTGNITVIY